MITEKELFQRKKEIETAKMEISELKGQLKGLLQRLSDEWGCKNIQEAKEKSKQIEKEIDYLKQEIENSCDSLTNKFIGNERD